MNERISFIFVRIKLAERFPSPSPYPRSAIIRHNANEIQCYRSVNLIDREDSAINSFFFPPPCFFFLFFLPTPFLFRRTRFARDRVILAYPRRRPANTREGEEGRGDASTELSTLEDARRLYRRVGSSWQGGCV